MHKYNIFMLINIIFMNILYSCNIIGYISMHECFKIHVLFLCACTHNVKYNILLDFEFELAES